MIIKVEAAGICGSDLHIYHWDINFPMRPPMIIGHEFSGSISEIGIAVAGWQVGDRVTSMTTAINCGRCRYCLTGFDNLCPERKTLEHTVSIAFPKTSNLLKERSQSPWPAAFMRSRSLPASTPGIWW